MASVTRTDQGEPKTVVCTDPIAEEIDQVQYAHDSGPCLYASRRQEVVSVPSMTDNGTWQPVRDAAVQRGVHSSLSLPLAAGEVRVGALNLYGRDDHAFSSVTPNAALLFAAQATAAVWHAETAERTRGLIKNLQTALESRELIGTAKGIVMANERLSAEAAFERLVAASQHRNIKLRDLAAEVIETGATPG